MANKEWVPVTETLPTSVPMYWIFPAGSGMPGKPTIFGRQSYSTPEGYLVVEVPAELEDNELARKGRRLITEAEYLLHLEEQNV